MAPRVRWIVPLCFGSILWAFGFGPAPVSLPLAAGPRGPGQRHRAQHRHLLPGNCRGGKPCPPAAGGPGKKLPGPGHGRIRIDHGLLSLVRMVARLVCLRGLNGVAGAFVSGAPGNLYQQAILRRGKSANFGIYAFCIALGMALGTFVGMAYYSSHPKTGFLAGSLTPVLGAAVVLAWQPTFAASTENGRRRAPFSMFRNFLSFGSTWSQGFLEGGMVGLLPLYLLHVGLSETTASCLMSGLMIGVILAHCPWPGWQTALAAPGILAACNIIALLGLVGLLFQPGTAWLAIFLFVVGACSGAFYPLGLALLGDRIPPSALACANGRYLAINSLGSLVGPAVAGAAMDRFGRVALFITGATAVAAMFAAWLALEIGFQRAS